MTMSVNARGPSEDSPVFKMENLKPLNRHLLVIPHTKDKETPTGVLLPDDYKPEENRFIEATIVDIASDCSDQIRKIKYDNRDGQTKKAIIDKTMLQPIAIRGKTYHLILENYSFPAAK